MAYRVIVKRRWWWQQDDFYSSKPIDVTVFDSGVLKVVNGDQTKVKSYNASGWKSVTSMVVPSKAKV